MQRIQITRGVVLGYGKEGRVGEIHEVEDHVARILIHHNQARIAPAPAPPPVPVALPKLQKAAKNLPEKVSE